MKITFWWKITFNLTEWFISPCKNCKKEPLDMGQIDSEKMYTNVMNGWGNSDKKNIPWSRNQKREYHLQNKSCSINGSIDCGEKFEQKKDYRFYDDKMPLDKSAITL
jgi:hypothetical protein